MMVLVIGKRHILVALLCCAVLILIPVAMMLSPSEATGGGVTNWGLSFPTPGQQPVGNASAVALREYDAYYVGGADKVIYLTFDAGFENGYTEGILETLKAHNAPATFFLVGHYLETAPELVCRMVEEGHLVGNHTYHHPDMAAIATREAFVAELTATEEKYREVTGQEMPKIYRPPQGKYSVENLEQAKELGYATVFWSLAYVDWVQDKQPTAEEAFDKLIPRVHSGAVVLLHSTSSTNAAILDELLSRWEALGYRFAPLTELTEQSTG